MATSRKVLDAKKKKSTPVKKKRDAGGAVKKKRTEPVKKKR